MVTAVGELVAAAYWVSAAIDAVTSHVPVLVAVKTPDVTEQPVAVPRSSAIAKVIAPEPL
jgi:hypothetical protein